ncbi:MAG TPA: hypothetical protein VLF71_03940 [Candidatus Saccharimonadales bacterium]|nr:hypothetical protein [Candidatus Saccharimonadales bacterium]
MTTHHTKQLMREWDPLGLITDHGTPPDEYDREAFELLLWFEKQPAATTDEVCSHISGILEDWAGPLSEEMRQECYEKAGALLQALQDDAKADTHK